MNTPFTDKNLHIAWSRLTPERARTEIRAAIESAKAAVAAMGFGVEHVRMPLTPMEDANRAKLFAEMRKLGVLK